MTLTPQSDMFRPVKMREGRVLVVDDEASIRMPIRRCLLQAGLEVVEAADGLTVKPNHVYVGAPGGLLGIAGGVLRRALGKEPT